jgi:hypothetical protein
MSYFILGRMSVKSLSLFKNLNYFVIQKKIKIKRRVFLHQSGEKGIQSISLVIYQLE